MENAKKDDAKSLRRKASNFEIYIKMQQVFIEMDDGPDTRIVVKELENLKNAVVTEDGEQGKAYDPNHINANLPLRVNEQRLSNLLRSPLTVIKQIPTLVLWGYFTYMAIGIQFWERLLP